MDSNKTDRLVGDAWDSDIVPQLVEYIRIPNKSPMFDADWQKHGYMDAATDLLADWARKQPIAGLVVEVVRLEGRTPLIYIEVPGEGDDCVLLYGHLDKQPEMTGWADDLGPWKPVIKGDKLYGRGGADDGYAICGSLAALRPPQDQGHRQHPRGRPGRRQDGTQSLHGDLQASDCRRPPGGQGRHPALACVRAD